MLISKRHKAFSIIFFAAILSTTLSGCASITNSIKTVLVGDTFPTLPNPEITTYVLDLSKSTNSIAQLNALNSGIEDFISGKSIGNPFSNPRVPPRGLNMQFISLISGQAPRYLLVSAETGQKLYDFIILNKINMDQSKPLWNGFMNAREIIFREKTYIDLQSCPNKVIETLGTQALPPEVLRAPAIQICQDALQTARAIDSLAAFNNKPGIALGSDVFGAVKLAISNMKRASEQFGSAKITIAFASDMIDENPKRKLIDNLDDKNLNACELGKKYSVEDFSSPGELSGLKIVLVGLGNTSIYKDLIEPNRTFWNCYFQEAGAEVSETTDLAGY
jgi:hypothetical protein